MCSVFVNHFGHCWPIWRNHVSVLERFGFKIDIYDSIIHNYLVSCLD